MYINDQDNLHTQKGSWIPYLPFYSNSLHFVKLTFWMTVICISGLHEASATSAAGIRKGKIDHCVCCFKNFPRKFINSTSVNFRAPPKQAEISFVYEWCLLGLKSLSVLLE